MIDREYKVRIAGSGGQGVITAGIILANAFFLEKYYVLQTQTYGAAVRGSAAACDVLLSRKEIFEFNMDEFNHLIIMNKPSLEAYGEKLKEQGILILFQSLWNENKHLSENKKYDIKIIDDKFILSKLRKTMPLSLSMIGAFVRITQGISLETLENAIKRNFSEKHHELNIKAIKLGFENVS